MQWLLGSNQGQKFLFLRLSKYIKMQIASNMLKAIGYYKN